MIQKGWRIWSTGAGHGSRGLRLGGSWIGDIDERRIVNDSDTMNGESFRKRAEEDDRPWMAWWRPLEWGLRMAGWRRGERDARHELLSEEKGWSE